MPAINAFEIETSARSIAPGLNMRVVLYVVGALLLVQTLLLGGAVWIGGELLLAIRDQGPGALPSTVSTGTVPTPPHSIHPGAPPPLVIPVVPTVNRKPLLPGTCREGVYVAHAFSDDLLEEHLIPHFDARMTSYPTDFAKLLVERMGGQLLLEFDLNLIGSPEDGSAPSPGLRLSVGARFATPPFDYIDASATEQPVLQILAIGKGDKVELRKLAAAPWLVQQKYRPDPKLHSQYVVLAHLPVVGHRVSAGCKRTHVIVQMQPFIDNGFFVTDSMGGLERHSIKAFPRNIDLTFAPVRICLFQLPEQAMIGRLADDRLGYFDTEVGALGHFRVDSARAAIGEKEYTIYPTVRMIQRMRIPDASHGPKEIRVYIDYSVPPALQEAIKLGVERWNKAFAALELGDRFIRAIKPGDKDWPADFDPSDIRYTVVCWAMDESSAWAIGQSVTDPRSGEILKGRIDLTSAWLDSWLDQAVLFNVNGFEPYDALASKALITVKRQLRATSAPWAAGPGSLWRGASLNTSMDVPHACRSRAGRSLRHRYPHEDTVCRALHSSPMMWLTGGSGFAGRTPEQIHDYLQAGIADVAVHEMGHVLGLRHNFRGSTAISFSNSQRKSYVTENGLGSSVMDYIDCNFMSKAERKKVSEELPEGEREDMEDVPVFSPTIGAYDQLAIEYGYTTIDDETCCSSPHATLKAIAAKYEDATFTFDTDENADHRDPFTLRFDLTDDPLRWHLDRVKLAQEAAEQLRVQAVKLGESGDLRPGDFADVQESLMVTALRGVLNAARFVGGLKTARNHRQSSGKGITTLSAVDQAMQERAVKGVLDFMVSPPGDGIFPAFTVQSSMVAKTDFLGMFPVDLDYIGDIVRVRAMQAIMDGDRWGRISLSAALNTKDGSSSIWPRKILRQISDRIFPIAAEWSPTTWLSVRYTWQLQLQYVQRLRDLQESDVNGRLAAILQAERRHLHNLLATFWHQIMQEEELPVADHEEGHAPVKAEAARTKELTPDQSEVRGFIEVLIRENGLGNFDKEVNLNTCKTIDLK